MKVYMCKRVHWQALLETKLYYVSELRLARHHGSDDFPAVGETVQFLADNILGTAEIKESYQNGYAGHFVLTNIDSRVQEDLEAKSTDLLHKASSSVKANIQALEYELFLLETEQQVVAASFSALESQKRSLQRRIAGKPVQLMEKRKTRRTEKRKRGTEMQVVPITVSTTI
jgi:hypothetical protein